MTPSYVTLSRPYSGALTLTLLVVLKISMFAAKRKHRFKRLAVYCESFQTCIQTLNSMWFLLQDVILSIQSRFLSDLSNFGMLICLKYKYAHPVCGQDIQSTERRYPIIDKCFFPFKCILLHSYGM